MARDFAGYIKTLNSLLVSMVTDELQRAGAVNGICQLLQSSGIDVRDWRWGPAPVEEETGLIEERICEVCGTDISHRSLAAKYCEGGACRQEAWRRRHGR